MNSALLKNNLAAIVADSQTRKVLSRSGLIAGYVYLPSFLRTLFQVEWMRRKQIMKVYGSPSSLKRCRV